MKSLDSLREKAKSLKDDQERSKPKETTSPPSPKQKKNCKKRVKKTSDASPKAVNVWEEYPEFVPLDYQPSTDVLRHITGHELLYPYDAVKSVFNLLRKEFCKEGASDKSEEAKEFEEQPLASNLRSNVNEGERDSYGPWMQVSYGKSNRSHLGHNPVGRKSWNQGNGGKQGLDVRQGSGSSNAEIVKNGTAEKNKKGVEIGKILMKVTSHQKNDKLAATNVARSRFTILNENLEEENSLENRQKKGSSSSVLTKISNRGLATKKLLNPIANKYLIDPATVKSNFSKNSKENGKEVWAKKYGKGTKKNSMQPTSAQPISMEQDIEDSEVLQSLHKKMVEVRVVEDQLPTVIEHHSPTEMITTDSGQQLVVVSDVSIFEVVASKLKEAMEVVLE
ncbi:hypothetical protein LWI29_020839 [Acer saccharum]|uniref:Uncharacterized protein n=1 Tax=Acer saccharum TaxID=4024 RepID=A0AA39RDQ9_ACESA|nr:hypothetical protein LWI29_020839 [Acer saccharum]